ncbi:MAG: alpha/beta hydrolase-fold protein [Pseudomonadota bacterium]
MRQAIFSVVAVLIAACANTPTTTESDGLHTVTIHAAVPDNSGQVYLAGSAPSLGPWRADGLLMQGDGRERVATLQLPEGAELEYKVTQGAWEHEGLGPSGMVMPNSHLTVHGDTDGAITVSDWKHDISEYVGDPAGSGVIGQLIYWRDVTSPLLQEKRNVEICLPPQYAANPTARFPVIYMQDGQNLFDPRIAYTGVDWGVDEAMQALVSDGTIEPAIIVGIWSTPARRFEYAPAGVLAMMTDDMKAVAASEFPPDLRVGDAYLRFIVEELKPRVDAAYRTRPGREGTFMMGSSMGALISVYGMGEYPNVFGGAAGLSMHWPVGIAEENFIQREAQWRPAIVTAWQRYFQAKHLDPATHRLWVDHGTGFLDHYYTSYQDAAVPMLHALGYVDGVSLEARTYPGANHNETAWRARLREPLTFLLRRSPPVH